MRGLRQSIALIAARGTALMLCLVTSPLWAARVAPTIFTGNPKRQFPAPGLWRIAKGECTFIGPAPGEAPAGDKPGLVSPSALRRRMGIAHTAGGESDAAFFANASVRQRLGLLLRYAWSCLLSAREPAGSRDVHVFGVRIDAVSMPGAVDRIIDACDARNKRPMQRVAFVNPDCLNKAMRDRDYHHLLNRADLVLPDGAGRFVLGGSGVGLHRPYRRHDHLVNRPHIRKGDQSTRFVSCVRMPARSVHPLGRLRVANDLKLLLQDSVANGPPATDQPRHLPLGEGVAFESGRMVGLLVPYAPPHPVGLDGSRKPSQVLVELPNLLAKSAVYLRM